MVGTIIQPVVCPVLIGRTPQLAALAHLIEEAYSGHGRIVALSGEAGIGKSRLAGEARARFLAHSRVGTGSARALTGYCFEPDRALPYAPLIDLLRGWLGTLPPDEITQAVGPLGGNLVPILPELGTRLSSSMSEVSTEPEQEKHKLFQALSGVLLRTQQPQIISIEDLHWCDDNSFEFLLYMARRVVAHPTLLLLTYRSDEIHPALRHFLAALDRERLVTELPLVGLSKEEVDRLIRAIFPQPGPVRSDFLDALYDLTEGNPFFLEEALKSLMSTGDIYYSDGRWTRKPLTALAIPRTVQDAVARRVEGISPEAARLLTLAAVAGRRFDFALLQEVADHGEGELLALLKELIAAQLVVEESDERFAFRHALTRQAVYGSLLARERRALHAKIAEAIERPAIRPAEAHISELAYHSYEAANWEQALRYARLAGEQAQSLYAPHAACEHFDRAIEASGHLSREPDSALYRARGQAHESLGNFDAACADYARALGAAREGGDKRAEWQSLFDLGFLWTGRNFEQAGYYLESALSLARAIGEPGMIAHTLNRVGNWYANIEQPGEGRLRHEEALAVFTGLDDRQGQATTLDLLGVSSLMAGDLVASAGYYEQAVALFRDLEDRQGLASCLGPFCLRGGSFKSLALMTARASAQECWDNGEEAVALMRQTGSRTGEAFALTYMSLMLGARGLYGRGWTAAQEAIGIAEEIGHNLTLCAASYALADMLMDLLIPEEAIGYAEKALDTSYKSGSLFLIRSSSAFYARVRIARREYERAAEVLDKALPAGAPVETLPQSLMALARMELALAQGEPRAALALADEMLAAGPEGATRGVIPTLWHKRAQALTALGDRASATQLLEAAQQAAREQEAPPILWRILVDLGHLYHVEGKRTAAADCWEAARKTIHKLAEEVADQMARATFVARAEALLPARSRPTSRQAAKQAAGGLTGRELEVTRLIAQGKTNREIALALVLSQRTVQVHITNTLSKLGFTSRAQIATWAVERGIA